MADHDLDPTELCDGCGQMRVHCDCEADYCAECGQDWEYCDCPD